MPEMPERDTSDEICLHAVAIDDSTTHSSVSILFSASFCTRRFRAFLAPLAPGCGRVRRNVVSERLQADSRKASGRCSDVSSVLRRRR